MKHIRIQTDFFKVFCSIMMIFHFLQVENHPFFVDDFVAMFSAENMTFIVNILH